MDALSQKTPLRWGVVGLGRAGKASLKAIHLLGEDLAVLSALASQRAQGQTVQQEEIWAQDILGQEILESMHHSTHTVRVYTQWQDLIRDPNIDAIAICSENALHASQVEQALLHHKHVWVHFPLCTHTQQVSALFALAQQQQKCLYVEVFSLLGERFQQWQDIHQQDKICTWHSHFQGGLYRWVQEELQAQHTVLLSFARLAQAWKLFGPLRCTYAALESSDDDYQLAIHLEPIHLEPISNQKEGLEASTLEVSTLTSISPQLDIKLYESRGIDVKRQQRFTVHTQQGQSLGAIPNQFRQFFIRDLQNFYACYQGQKEAYLSADDLLGIYQLMDQINEYLSKEND